MLGQTKHQTHSPMFKVGHFFHGILYTKLLSYIMRILKDLKMSCNYTDSPFKYGGVEYFVLSVVEVSVFALCDLAGVLE